MSQNKNGSSSRYELYAKRRRVNKIYNTLITIVLLLIFLVIGVIFFGDNQIDQLSEKKESTEQGSQTIPVEVEDEQEKTEEGEQAQQKDIDEKDEEVDRALNEEEGIKTVIVESNEPNVEYEYFDPSWDAIGTEQVGEHHSSWEMGSIDWIEKEKAAAYAVHIPVENLINWWTERGKDPAKDAILTISEKGKDDTYRVYIEWIDGKGWKPIKVQKLIENDKKPS